MIAAVIADGVASGEFHAPDVGTAALCTLTAMVRFYPSAIDRRICRQAQPDA